MALLGIKNNKLQDENLGVFLVLGIN